MQWFYGNFLLSCTKKLHTSKYRLLLHKNLKPPIDVIDTLYVINQPSYSFALGMFKWALINVSFQPHFFKSKFVVSKYFCLQNEWPVACPSSNQRWYNIATLPNQTNVIHLNYTLHEVSSNGRCTSQTCEKYTTSEMQWNST